MILTANHEQRTNYNATTGDMEQRVRPLSTKETVDEGWACCEQTRLHCPRRSATGFENKKRLILPTIDTSEVQNLLSLVPNTTWHLTEPYDRVSDKTSDANQLQTIISLISFLAVGNSAATKKLSSTRITEPWTVPMRSKVPNTIIKSKKETRN